MCAGLCLHGKMLKDFLQIAVWYYQLRCREEYTNVFRLLAQLQTALFLHSNSGTLCFGGLLRFSLNRFRQMGKHCGEWHWQPWTSTRLEISGEFIILVIIFLRACSGPGGSEIYQAKVKGIQERNIGTRWSRRIRGGASPPSDEWNSFLYSHMCPECSLSLA